MSWWGSQEREKLRWGLTYLQESMKKGSNTLQDAAGSQESLNKHPSCKGSGGGAAAAREQRYIVPAVAHGVVFHHPHPKQGTGTSRALLWLYMGVNETLKLVSS